MTRKSFAAAFAMTMAAVTTSALALDLDPALPPYKAASGISGQLASVGSDTLGSLSKLWADGLRELYPSVKIEIESKGSATAPPALVDGTSQLGPMSRPMKNQEVEAFTSKFGYKPSRFRVAVDALAVYVNKDNPIQCLTLQQVDRIFSKTRWGSGGDNAKTWGDVGLAGDWATQSITLYGRNAASGTHDYFKESVLYNGDFKDEVKEQPGSAEVVKMVAGDRFAIGYSGIGYETDGVRAVPLAVSAGRHCYDTSPEAAYANDYPVARYLYIYLNKNPNQPLDPLLAETVKYILSKDGQTRTIQGGFYPITKSDRLKDLEALGIPTETN